MTARPDMWCRLTSLDALAQRQPHVHHFLLARAREQQADGIWRCVEGGGVMNWLRM
jgi:hypothetical protein